MKDKKKIYIPPAIERVRDCDDLLAANIGISSEEDDDSRQSKGSSFSFEEKEPDYGW